MRHRFGVSTLLVFSLIQHGAVDLLGETLSRPRNSVSVFHRPHPRRRDGRRVEARHGSGLGNEPSSEKVQRQK